MSTSIPYGLRDIHLTAYDATGTTLANVSIDLPNASTLTFTESEEFNTLRGDDRDVAKHGNGPTVSGDFEAGGFSFEAFKMISGASSSTSGSGSTLKTILNKKTTGQRPYFRIEGQIISDSGGDVHAVIYKAKCTGDLGGEFKDGEFFITSGSFEAIGDGADNLWDIIGNAAVTGFVEPNPV